MRRNSNNAWISSEGKVSLTTMLGEIPRLGNDKGYKYLGILESSDCLTKTVKDNTIKEYLSL
eukprot:3926655-Ditylum_brightwellii.AAC.1